MTVYGVGNAAYTPAASSQNSIQQQQPIAAVSVGTGEPVVYQEPEKSSGKTAKVLLSLATLGAITYGIIRYRNAQALKPIIENLEKATKDGGKLATQLTKQKVKNPDGTTKEVLVKSVKTHFDKEGKKHAEIIHDFKTNERFTVIYDKDGNVAKNVVSRMSVPVNGQKSKLEQNLTNIYTRNGDNITTTTRVVDYSGTKPAELYKRTEIYTKPTPQLNATANINTD